MTIHTFDYFAHPDYFAQTVKVGEELYVERVENDVGLAHFSDPLPLGSKTTMRLYYTYCSATFRSTSTVKLG